MSASVATDGSHLTTSRINRLLRPLRNKCLSLSKYLTVARHSASSLPHSQNWLPESPPPLAILRPPPSATRGRLCLDKGFAEDMELSRLLYAVCDAFRNLLQVTHGAVPGEPIPSLAAMCCFVVGGNVPLSTDGTHEDQEEAISEDGLMRAVDEIYDVIPTYYRRHSIASHALSLILALCPHHHHTLVSTLLDICVSFGLVHESHRLLSMLLENALLPTSSSPSPITHPAHVSYLTDLLVRWISGSNNLILSNTLPLFSVSTFSRAVLGVLARSDVSLWSSKAVSRFACSVESTDIDSFVTLLDFLIETIHHYQPTRTSGQGKEKENTDAVVLRGCLQDWMNRLFVVIASASGVLADRSCCHSIVSILMLLDRCRSYGLHTLRLGASHQPFQNELPDAIATLAAHLHVAYSLADYDSRLLRLLREVSPIPTTFSQLVEHMYRNRNSAQDFMTSLQQFSTAFQIHNLLQLDVSLWNCALRIFESAPKGTSKEMETIKLLLIDTVDEAERRLFGAGALDSSPAVRLPGQSKRSSGAHYRRPSGEWEWEEMVGGWIRKTPIHAQKKQKTTHINLHESPVFIRRLLRRGAQRNSSNGATISVKSAKSALISSASKASNSRLPLSQGSDNYAKSNDSSGWDEEDEENEENVMPSSPMAERRSTLKPRHSNFSSILADAQRNRVNLHKPQPPSVSAVKKPASSSVLPKSQQSRLPLAQKRFFVPAVCLSEAALTSDDSMDLFACATSSPRA